MSQTPSKLIIFGSIFKQYTDKIACKVTYLIIS